MATLKHVFTNKYMLCGITGIGAILIWKRFHNNEQKRSEINKDKFFPLLSSMKQRYLFTMTSFIWLSLLKPNIFPVASQFLSKRLQRLYPLLPSLSFSTICLNTFGTKQGGLIAAGVSMILLTAYRKSQICHNIMHKILTNHVSLRIYEYLCYSMPLFAMIQTASLDINSFNYFMAWFSGIFVSNSLSVSVGDPLFTFAKVRHIPYLSLITYSLGLLSPNIDCTKGADLTYAITSCVYASLFVAYKLGFDNGNIKAYPLLCNVFMVIPYLYFKPAISLYIGTFYFIPNMYYFYYVLGKEEITEIVPRVYLANMVAVNAENIKKYDIGNIVEIHDEYKKTKRFEVNYLCFKIQDRSFVEIHKKFDETNTFIANCVENEENVVIHCSAGVSRSATIVAAYLIYSGYSFEDTMQRMKRLRTSFDPNTGFAVQLKKFARISSQKV